MVSYGEVDTVMLFGGGPLLADAVETLQTKHVELTAIVGPRHADGPADWNGEKILRSFLENRDVGFIETDSVDIPEVADTITNTTFGLSLSAPWVFPESFIDRFDRAFVNIHGSRLPQDRGGGGYSWRILRDERMGYWQIHEVTPDIDDGGIILTDEFRFPDHCRHPIDFDSHAHDRGVALLDRFFDQLVRGEEFDVTGQPPYLSSYWPRLSTDRHGYVDWSWSLLELERFIRAFDDPYGGAQTFVGDEPVRIKKANTIVSDGQFHPFQTGIIYRIQNGIAFVAANEGSLLIEEVLDNDGNDVFGELSPGDRFFTPTEHLQKAKQQRVRYSASGVVGDDE